MSSSLNGIASAILKGVLPDSLNELFHSDRAKNFCLPTPTDQVQFYKVTPHNLVLGDGADIICKSIAFHNGIGGLFVFGASDEGFTDILLNERLNIDIFNWVIKNWTGGSVRTVSKRFPYLASDMECVEVFMVLPRREAPILHLTRGFHRFNSDTILVINDNKVVQAKADHFDLLSLGSDVEFGRPVIQSGLPSKASFPSRFVGRNAQLTAMLAWFSQKQQQRLSIKGVKGAGKTSLALEFVRRLSVSATRMILPGGVRLDHVVYLGADNWESETEYTLSSESNLWLQRSMRILKLTNTLDIDFRSTDTNYIEQQICHFFLTKVVLVVLDDIIDEECKRVGFADDRLLMLVVGGSPHSKIIRTYASGGWMVVDRKIVLDGFDTDDEYLSFFGMICDLFCIPAPTILECASIVRFSAGSLVRMQEVFMRRRTASSYSDAIRMSRSVEVSI